MIIRRKPIGISSLRKPNTIGMQILRSSLQRMTLHTVQRDLPYAEPLYWGDRGYSEAEDSGDYADYAEDTDYGYESQFNDAIGRAESPTPNAAPRATAQRSVQRQPAPNRRSAPSNRTQAQRPVQRQPASTSLPPNSGASRRQQLTEGDNMPRDLLSIMGLHRSEVEKPGPSLSDILKQPDSTSVRNAPGQPGVQRTPRPAVKPGTPVRSAISDVIPPRRNTAQRAFDPNIPEPDDLPDSPDFTQFADSTPPASPVQVQRTPATPVANSATPQPESPADFNDPDAAPKVRRRGKVVDLTPPKTGLPFGLEELPENYESLMRPTPTRTENLVNREMQAPTPPIAPTPTDRESAIQRAIAYAEGPTPPDEPDPQPPTSQKPAPIQEDFSPIGMPTERARSQPSPTAQRTPELDSPESSNDVFVAALAQSAQAETSITQPNHADTPRSASASESYQSALSDAIQRAEAPTNQPSTSTPPQTPQSTSSFSPIGAPIDRARPQGSIAQRTADLSRPESTHDAFFAALDYAAQSGTVDGEGVETPDSPASSPPVQRDYTPPGYSDSESYQAAINAAIRTAESPTPTTPESSDSASETVTRPSNAVQPSRFPAEFTAIEGGKSDQESGQRAEKSNQRSAVSGQLNTSPASDPVQRAEKSHQRSAISDELHQTGNSPDPQRNTATQQAVRRAARLSNVSQVIALPEPSPIATPYTPSLVGRVPAIQRVWAGQPEYAASWEIDAADSSEGLEVSESAAPVFSPPNNNHFSSSTPPRSASSSAQRTVQRTYAPSIESDSAWETTPQWGSVANRATLRIPTLLGNRDSAPRPSASERQSVQRTFANPTPSARKTGSPSRASSRRSSANDAQYTVSDPAHVSSPNTVSRKLNARSTNAPVAHERGVRRSEWVNSPTLIQRNPGLSVDSSEGVTMFGQPGTSPSPGTVSRKRTSGESFDPQGRVPQNMSADFIDPERDSYDFSADFSDSFDMPNTSDTPGPFNGPSLSFGRLTRRSIQRTIAQPAPDFGLDTPDDSPMSVPSATESGLLSLIGLPENTPVWRDPTPQTATATDTIQRAPEDQPQSVSAEPSGGSDNRAVAQSSQLMGSEAKPGDTDPAKDQMLIDKMAEEVYRVLRDRLRVERERFLGRR